MGVFAALAIAIHNFPEGMATFFATLHDPTLGVAIAVAVALHNIPEGIAVAVPIYYATGSRKKAFWLSFLSGLAEPLGAVIGYLILRPLLFGHGVRSGFRRGGRDHGFHLHRRTLPRGQGIRPGPRPHLRPDPRA
jgi:hypothetical protein